MCHSEERSDEESQAMLQILRLRLRMTYVLFTFCVVVLQILRFFAFGSE